MSEESKLNQGIINRIRRQMSNLMFLYDYYPIAHVLIMAACMSLHVVLNHVDVDLEIFSIQVNNVYLI